MFTSLLTLLFVNISDKISYFNYGFFIFKLFAENDSIKGFSLSFFINQLLNNRDDTSKHSDAVRAFK
jgi:hypothetical protein